jgi:hypothetical protein
VSWFAELTAKFSEFPVELGECCVEFRVAPGREVIDEACEAGYGGLGVEMVGVLHGMDSFP